MEAGPGIGSVAKHMARKTKKQRRVQLNAKKEFTPQTRLYDKVRPEHHTDLRQLVEEIIPFLVNRESVEWKSLRRLEIDYQTKSQGKRSKPSSDVINCIARFLIRIGKSDGLKCSMAVFIRYLSSEEHSNFKMNEKSLNTMIYRALSYFESK